MKTIKLRLFELLALEIEMNGLKDPNDGKELVKGFINQKLPLITKYEQLPLSETLIKEKETLNVLRNDLIRQYGIEDGDMVVVKALLEIKDSEGEVIGTMPNPDFEELNKAFEELINQEKEINYTPIKLKALSNIETEENYVILYKLIEPGE